MGDGGDNGAWWWAKKKASASQLSEGGGKHGVVVGKKPLRLAIERGMGGWWCQTGTQTDATRRTIPPHCSVPVRIYIT